MDFILDKVYFVFKEVNGRKRRGEYGVEEMLELVFNYIIGIVKMLGLEILWRFIFFLIL